MTASFTKHLVLADRQALTDLAAELKVSEDVVVAGIITTFFAADKKPASRRRDRLIKADDGQIFPNANAAGRALKLHGRLILEVLKGRRKHTGGRTFTYA